MKIVTSYLSNHKDIISHPNSSADLSITSALKTGCPRGNVLSPFLCNVLLDPVLRLTFAFPFSVIAYADDLVLMSHKNISTAHASLHVLCDFVATMCV